MTNVNRCLEAGSGWMRASKWMLHLNKMEVLLVGGRIGPEIEVSPVLEQMALPFLSLGVLLGNQVAAVAMSILGFSWTKNALPQLSVS